MTPLKTRLPIYLPDATRGVVKSLDTNDLLNCGVEGVVVNTLHLAETPGLDYLRKIGGVKKLMGFEGLVVSDSGGWQLFSLIHRSNSQGSITNDGVFFKNGTNRKNIFTPEDSISSQFDIGSDILICLDDFTPPNSNSLRERESVERTILWAQRCKAEFERQVDKRSLSDTSLPLLFSVIQGGFDRKLRAQCASELIAIGFDGYGYGGYAVTENGLDLELSKFVADLIPNDKYKFALGSGTLSDIANLAGYGWQIFDCTLPTRDARHGRLYIYNSALNFPAEYVYIERSKFSEDQSPIDDTCDCHTCKNFTKSYLHHLFKIKDFTAYRLATIHNLRCYTRLTEFLRKPSI
ncbi:hypothetical protein A3K34_02185 [candidate division WWE3 bacterium RIFOXYC1_FULL_40_10]|uniref:tRNA-guanine(15) transglycosylase-like domain-containing protein n=1 Tax=candidate division WWE3 bacterium RIFOXYA2_FULL_46_9 TaxID=1802636 RepID=A0A1F4W1X7_UNCKA|nr:MAG: hypothetical protein A3K58_02185 [candidate division WWE3 bacterium RIFOXYB1_FULL_40_22]OGC61662.1 MAG: hypothetical protein A3K37_02185 [candidate division WWE3 bacterium RIFOXYA1_FULL_40_11]OGC63288.1 MAG: hypothetical protein A2264_02805 [candidate division WWE3 bacterium RIFOXYA2_FULL_46_9]OGC64419.1 MAG: hypothetical protein A2326_02640 [candidate division WWE3 bacterium RIFOXYB2_FULL_41_6]OGC66045.1 MAG: hypothetical protein A3K34_02185 [candidate division WWE3 bacterium RIFOXYC1_